MLTSAFDWSALLRILFTNKYLVSQIYQIKAMIATTLSACLVLVALYLLKLVVQLRRNIAAAKASGIPYTIAPFFAVNRLYMLSCIVLLPLYRWFPKSWTEWWVDMTLDWGWRRRYEAFASMGADTFLVVTPERIMMHVAEASVITQITARKTDFPKALEVYESLRVYGTNIVTVEGQEWRRHRKIVNPSFGEKNNQLVWTETLAQTRDMLNGWFGENKERTGSLRTIADDAMRLSLHIISSAGFGVPMVWPGSDVDEKKAAQEPKFVNGHKMTYTDALGSLLHNIVPIIALPTSLLKILPFELTRSSYQSYLEWGQYMREMYDDKKNLILSNEEGDSLDLMTSMVKGAGISSKETSTDTTTTTPPSLSNEEIMGNAFVFILAGHETTANSIHFCLIYLALNIPAQRHLQRDLDTTFQSRPVSDWDYDSDIPKLFSNMAGAVLNEELRLLPPTTQIPKKTEPHTAQPIIANGKKCTVPPHTFIALSPHCAHRNPNQWPHGPPADPDHPSHPLSNRDNDLEEFKPERWLLAPGTSNQPVTSGADAAMNGGPSNDENDSTPDTSPQLYHPPKGAYIPFSDGQRACIGRRFAQIELLAFLAYVFSQYSVELCVKEWADDEAVAKMGSVGKRECWEKAKTKAEDQMVNDMWSIITLQLRKGYIPLRLVQRGGEVFDYR